MSTIDLATYSYNIELNSKGFSDGMKDAEGQTESLKSKFSGLITFLKGAVAGGLAAVGAAIAGTVVSGVKATADLDEQMSKFRSSVGASLEETEEIRKLSQDLFKVNTDSMEDIVATAAELKKSMGLNTAEIKKYQQSYMDYAKTTGQANTDVVQAIDDIGDAWQLSAEQSVKSLDMFKLSSEKFGTDIAGVQRAMQQLAPASKALGLEFEETNGLLNMMAEGGLDASSAVTALNYAAKTVESPEEFRKMLTDIQAIEDPTQKTAKSVELFGARAGVAMSNILDGTRNMEDFIVTMESASGTVSKASDNFDNNLNIQIQLAKKQFVGLAQELGEKFMPSINKILQFVNANMPSAIAFIESAINTAGSAIDFTIGAIQDLTKFFQEHWSVIEPILIGIGAGAATFGIYTLAINASAIATGIWTTVTSVATAAGTAFGAVLAFITSPIGIVVIAIGALVAAVIALWKNWDTVSEFLKSSWESIGNFATNIFTSIGDFFKNMWEGVKNTTINVWNSIKDYLSPLLDALTWIFRNLTIPGIIFSHWDTIKTTTINVWNGIKQFFIDLWEGIISYLKGIPQIFNNIGQAMFQGLWSGLQSVWSSISSWISSTVSWISDKLTFWKKSKDEMSDTNVGSLKVPSYDVGTPFVPRTGLALIHKGEAVIPAKYNPYNSSNNMGSVGNAQPTENHYHIQNLNFPNATSKVDDIIGAFERLPTLALQYSKR